MKLLAQLTNPVLPKSIGEGGVEKGGTATGQLISNVIGGMIIVGFIIALFYLITGAFHWITSGGDKANLENARGKIIQAIVGVIILVAAWATMTVVAQFFGWDFTQLPIPTIK
ncbi:hypothetical protein HY409_01760 [Candidatus Gottesmanbacteria bacterium]|nr:hypothetical protein [Candidatus Gottesmanbacteria bacterium]